MNAYSVKELNALVASGTMTLEQAVAHCEAVIARKTTQESPNKLMRWTRVRDGFAAGKPITVKAAFAAMPDKPAAKPAKAKAAPKAKAQADDPMTAIARQMEALTAAFAALAAKR